MLEVAVAFAGGDSTVFKNVVDVIVTPEGDVYTKAYVSMMRKDKDGNKKYEQVYRKPMSVVIGQD